MNDLFTLPTQGETQAALPRLPDGMYSFAGIRDRGAIYVDKTQHLFKLLQRPRLFFARPRRFGKSLTVSTLDAFFSGKKELFRGLAAEKLLQAPDFTPRTVLHLDMAGVSGEKEILLARLRGTLQREAAKHGLTLTCEEPSSGFADLISMLYARDNKRLVILVDEYDTPVQRAIEKGDAQRLEDSVEIMRDFYLNIKTADAWLDFVFITGISKLSQRGVFSAALNHLSDISTDPDFAALTGFTRQEIVDNFTPYLEKRGKDFGISPEEMLEEMEDYYNGFSFDGKTRVFNPFSAVMFFSKTLNKFDNFWMKSGSRLYIGALLKQGGLRVEDLRGKKTTWHELDSSNERSLPHLILYQAGYLSPRWKPEDDELTLDYPNTEVLTDISHLFLENFYPDMGECVTLQKEFHRRLLDGDVDGMVRALNLFLGSIPHHVYDSFNKTPPDPLSVPDPDADAETQQVLERQAKQRKHEAGYQTVLYAFLTSTYGHAVTMEDNSSLGRRDITVSLPNGIYSDLIIELKTGHGAMEAQQAAENAWRQMHTKSYGDGCPNPLLLALGFDERARKITDYKSNAPQPSN